MMPFGSEVFDEEQDIDRIAKVLFFFALSLRKFIVDNIKKSIIQIVI